MVLRWRTIEETCVRHRLMFVTAVGLLLFTMCLSKWWIHEDLPVEEASVKHVEKRSDHATRLLEAKDVCYDLHVFTMKTPRNLKKPVKNQVSVYEKKAPQAKQEKPTRKHGVNETLLICAMLVLLIISSIVSLADVLKVKRMQKSGSTSPDSEVSEKCSLAEFANMKRPRRESSLGGPGYSAPSHREPPVLCRFESVGTAFSRMRRDSSSVSACAGLPGTETPNTPPIGGAKTPLKLLGARPAPMLRRSSFPASSLMEGVDHRRRLSIDSEDDSSPDTSRKRVRIIRRH